MVHFTRACFGVAIWALVAAVGPGAAHAADSEGNFAIDGAGSMSCERFAKAYDQKTRDYYVYAGWIDGYVTATNQREDGVYDLTPWQTTELLLDLAAQYCRANPDRQFIYGVTKLLGFLYPGRLESYSEIVEIEHGDRGQYLYSATIMRVQETLAGTGLYDGPIDGSFDDELRAAVTAFQKQADMPANGWLDQRTLFALFKVSRDTETSEPSK